MTLPEAMTAYGPAWLQYWVYILLAGGFIAPILLLIWKQSRLTGVYALIAGVLSAVGVDYIYKQLGYVKLLGLPHILLWTPLAILLWRQIVRPDMPDTPRRIMMFILAVIAISLAFDYTDVVRYILGERIALGAI